MKARSVEGAARFYVDVLGLTVIRRQEDERGLRSIWLALDAEGVAFEGAIPFLALERADDEGPLRGDDAPGWHCVALPIARGDRAAWREHLERAGHAIVRESPYTLYVRDPEGAMIGLSHYPVPEGGPTPEGGPAPGDGRARALLGLLTLLTCALVALGLAPFHRGEAQARRPRAPSDVLIIGSSSVNGALGRLIETELSQAGFHPERRAHSSSGFSRPDFFDWDSEIAALGDLHALRAIVVYAGGNDAQAIRLRERELPAEARASARARSSSEWIVWRDEARWRSVYEARVRRFVDTLCEGGAPRVVMLLPTEGENQRWSERMERIRELQDSATRASRCGRVVDPRGARLREGATVDGVHLTRTGARAVWERMGASLLEAVGAPPASGDR